MAARTSSAVSLEVSLQDTFPKQVSEITPLVEQQMEHHLDVASHQDRLEKLGDPLRHLMNLLWMGKLDRINQVHILQHSKEVDGNGGG